MVQLILITYSSLRVHVLFAVDMRLSAMEEGENAGFGLLVLIQALNGSSLTEEGQDLGICGHSVYVVQGEK